MPVKEIIGKARFSNGKLVTVICEIENSINSRSLTYLTIGTITRTGRTCKKISC